MKKIMPLLVFLVFCFNGIQAQTPKLDQLMLIRQLVGTWKFDMGKDSVFLIEIEQAGKCLIETDYLVVNGKKEMDSKWTYGYSPETDQFRFFAVYPNGQYQTWIGSFTSEKTWVQHMVKDFNPDMIIMKAQLDFTSPDSYVAFQMKPDGQKIGKDMKGVRVRQ